MGSPAKNSSPDCFLLPSCVFCSILRPWRTLSSKPPAKGTVVPLESQNSPKTFAIQPLKSQVKATAFLPPPFCIFNQLVLTVNICKVGVINISVWLSTAVWCLAVRIAAHVAHIRSTLWVLLRSSLLVHL